MEVTYPQSTALAQGRAALRLPLTAAVALSALVGLYVVLVPSVHLAPGMDLFNGKRLLQLGLLAGAALVLLVLKQMRTGWLRTFAELPLAARAGLGAVFVLGVVSALRAPLPRYALLEVGHFVLLFALAVAVAQVCRQHPALRDRVLVGVVVLSAMLYVVTFSVGYASHLWAGTLLWPDAVTGFANIRFFNQYQTWTLPLLVAAPVLLGGRSRLLRAALYLPAACWWMLLFASGGRGTSIAVVGAMVAVGLLFRQAAWPWLKRQLVVFAGGSVLFVLLFKVLVVTQDSLLERNLSGGGRLTAWGDALGLLREAPLLGVGPMHYAYFPFDALWGHPHNALLQWGAEWGALSLLLVIGLTGWGLWAWTQHAHRRLKRERDEAFLMRVALTAALLAGAAHALVSGLLVMPLSQLLLVLVVGWAWSLMPRRERSLERPARWKHGALGLVVALALCFVVSGAAQDVGRLEERQATFVQHHAESSGLHTRIFPRYWQQGYFGY